MTKRKNTPSLFNREQNLLRYLTRRKFMQFTATASFAAATTKLVGCESGADSGASPKAGAETARTKGGGGTLRILAWPGYDEPEIIDGFKQQYGVEVEFKTYIGGEQMLQFFNQSPPGTFDGLISDGEYVAKLVALDAIDQLNPDDLPNLKDYHPTYQTFPGFYQGDALMASGARFGNYGIAFNQTLIDPAEVDSWEFLLRSDLQGKIALFDWYLPNMGNASLALFPANPNPYDLRDDQLNQVREWMLRLKPNVALITPNVQDIVSAFISGDIAAGPVGDWVIQNAIADGETEFTAIVPQEGAIRWSEAAAVCKASQNKELALAWVKYMSTPEVQARLANAQAYKGIAPNMKAIDFLSDSEKELLGYIPDPDNPAKLIMESQLERTRARQLPLQQAEKVWQDIYNEFKTA
ncbi:MAG: extracellular solute-binding protein [Pseudanabaenales cyanobacterium]|nr:extracellular solute-binding protein [Pseudanabaenales cyanobacterium]